MVITNVHESTLQVSDQVPACHTLVLWVRGCSPPMIEYSKALPCVCLRGSGREQPRWEMLL